MSLCSGRGGSYAMSDMCHARIVQRRLWGGVLTLDCRGYGTPSLRGIPLASWNGNASLSREMWRNSRRRTLLLNLTTSKTLNILYYWRCDMVRALGWHHRIWMFDVKTSVSNRSVFGLFLI